MIEIRNLKLQLSAGLPTGENEIKRAVAKRLGIAPKSIADVRLLKRSVDARRKSDFHFVATVSVTVAGSSSEKDEARIVERVAKVADFTRKGVLDPESNIQFGEGGAGTFSDGKLNTNIHNPRCLTVLEEFVQAGAPEEILWQAKPHVGTDHLTNAVKNIRRKIESFGGEVRFETRLIGIELNNAHELVGVTVESEAGREVIPANTLVLATGHSARDTFEMLHQAGAVLTQKAFSIGVRIEHDQQMINKSQYGSAAQHPALGAADYKLSCHLSSGRSVYTFCMCPGGYVVAAASEEGGVVTNGMSRFARAGDSANAAFLVNVVPEDFESKHPLAGVEFQRRWERTAFEIAGSTYKAPAQRLGDFMRGKPSTNCGAVKPPTRLVFRMEMCRPVCQSLLQPRCVKLYQSSIIACEDSLRLMHF